MDFFRQTWVWVTGLLLSSWVFIRSIVFYSLRLRSKQAMLLLELLKKRGHQFILEEELADRVLPKIYSACCFMHGTVFWLKIEERMMQAGFAGTDAVALLYLPRWSVKKFKIMLNLPDEDVDDINIYILQPWDAQKIGSLKIPKIIPPLYLDRNVYTMIDEGLKWLFSGEDDKFGSLLHGAPGNGKTYMIRHFALKYKLPIYIVALTKGLDNQNLIRMFSEIRGPGIVTFEDFDSYFKGRECQLQRPEFTFDVILNVLDGVYSTPDKMAYFMTAQDINNVDPALKSRPSRFKYVCEIGNPDEITRRSVFGAECPIDLIERTSGFSLDMCIMVRNAYDHGEDVKLAIDRAKQMVLSSPAPIFFKKEEKEAPTTAGPLK